MARNRALTEVRTRELLSDVLQRASGEGLRVFTAKEWFDLFVKGKRKARADKTARKHEQIKNEFIDFLAHRANLNVEAITSADIAAFRDQRQSRGLAASTLNDDITILSAAFNAALRQGHISVNPCLAIEPVKDKIAVRKQTFSPEQVTALLKGANAEWRGLILVAFYTGQRLGDCANLQWKQIEQGKTGAVVIVAIHAVLEDYLLSLPAPKIDDAYLFPSLAQRNISPLSKAFKKIMERANIEQRVIRECSQSGVRPQSQRLNVSFVAP
jgi:integrase